MKRISLRITAVIMSSFILFFLIGTIIRHKGRMSFHENRLLADKPRPSVSALMDGSFTDQLSACITDYFAGRSRWISASSAIQAELGECIINGVYADDERLLNVDRPENYAIDLTVSAVNDYASSNDGAVCFVAVPTSSGVYSDRLPGYIFKDYERRQIDALYEALDDSIRTVNAYNVLRMLNDNYIYYRNDTKWTSYGAYCVYRTVIQKLGFQPVAYDKYIFNHISSDFYGDLYNRTGYTRAKADIIDIYEYPDGAAVTGCTKYYSDGSVEEEAGLYDLSLLDSSYKYNVYMGGEAAVTKIYTEVKNDKNLLVIKDSYADCFLPFLTQHYSEITVVSPRDLTVPLSRFIDTSDYGQTLFLFGIDGLGDGSLFENICK